jgi:hypothetical protein
MEALGAAGSIIGIAVSIKMATELYDFFRSVKDAPEEIQTLRDCIGSLHATLVDVRRIVCDSPRLSSQPVQSVEALSRSLGICVNCFSRINLLADKFDEERLRSWAGGSWVRRFRFAFKNLEIAATMGILEEQKSTLQLSISILEQYVKFLKVICGMIITYYIGSDQLLCMTT